MMRLLPIASLLAPLFLSIACGDRAAPSASGPATELSGRPAAIAPAEEAIHTPDLATLDPAAMTHADIEAALGAPPACAFSYSKAGRPVVAVTPDGDRPGLGVIKLHAELVEMDVQGTADLTEGVSLAAPGVRVDVAPLEEADVHRTGPLTRQNAEMRFMLEEGLTVGYRGFYRCGG